MSSKMLKFVSTDKAMPEKRKAEGADVADFDEIYDDFDALSRLKRNHRAVRNAGCRSVR
jgi:hypothetical protein